MDAITLAAIDRCIRCRISFIAYALPGERDVTFFANPSAGIGSDSANATISFFGHSAKSVSISAELDAGEVLKTDLRRHHDPEITPYVRSTDSKSHHIAVERIVERLRNDGGKTVLSRTIAGQRRSDDWRPVIESVFEKSTFAFRFVYYTHATGCWLGASPELLGCIDSNCIFSTMALAGTRTNGEPWDSKNREEHQFVIDYITETLTSAGLRPTVGKEETVTCGPVEHLRHIISASVKESSLSFSDIINRLSPTPALAGYPLDPALLDISLNEAHPRYCYGGYIALHLPDGTSRAYVNLRSCHFHDRHYCIYAGGGITAQSDPAIEWDETEAKASAILSSIT